MSRVLIAIIVSLMLTACGSSNVPLMPLTESAIKPPCKFESPSEDPDEDLAIDVRNMKCGAELRAQVLDLQKLIKGP
ncbi:prokaryotic lipoprotein lipid attachment site [Escherichia phage Ioannina]|nr:prokaryotic lipoprotein lipid attachment site [Escherichia phage Ioannina]